MSSAACSSLKIRTIGIVVHWHDGIQCKHEQYYHRNIFIGMNSVKEHYTKQHVQNDIA